jgi:hypothetical protein
LLAKIGVLEMHPRIGLFTIKYKNSLPTPLGWSEYNCSGNFAERECWHFRNFFDQEAFNTNNFDYIGLFSPRYREKINISAAQIRSYIYENTEYEAFIFNPFPWNALEWYNVWEQGFSCHPGLKARTIYLFDSLGFSRSHLTKRHGLEVAAYCNYIVGSLDFWKKYLNYLQPFYSFVDNQHSRGPLYDECPYDNGPVTYIPFIFERLLSTFIKDYMESRIKVVSLGEWYLPIEKQAVNSFETLDQQLNEKYSYAKEWEIRKLINDWNFNKKKQAFVKEKVVRTTAYS